MSSADTNIIRSAAKFLQTPANPERPLEEKIRFLIKEKKLTQFQLIAALKQANLYSIDTIEPILRMHYFEQSDKKTKKQMKKEQKKASQIQKQQDAQRMQQDGQTQSSSSSSSSWSPWWSTISSIGIGLASFVASYTVSTTASQNLVKRSEENTKTKLDSVKTEIKEQADLDRERQHRDLMEVVNLLKTQVQCVQQNLGVLKQSIDVIQTQMKYNNNNNNNNSNINNNNNNNMGIINNMNNSNNSDIMCKDKMKNNDRGNVDDGTSIISSHVSSRNESRPNLGVIGNLLSQNDDGLGWLDEDIITSDNDKKESVIDNDNKNDNNLQIRNDKKQNMDNDNNDNNDNENNQSKKKMNENENDYEVLIYHPDYKDMIKTLPTDIIEIKQQLTDLLNLWQRNVSNNNEDLNIDKIKAGINALIFYINKILKKPYMEQPRKINTYNKQYKERLSNLPRIDTLLTLIGYEKKNVFWTLPLLYKPKNDDKDDEQNKKLHDKQIEFLTSFKTVLSNLFKTIDDSLPFSLTESIQKLKQERQDKINNEQKQQEIKQQEIKQPEAKQPEIEEKEEIKQDATMENTNIIATNANNGNANNGNYKSNNNDNGNMNENGNMNNNNAAITNPPETKYSNKFMEIAQLVAQGKTPDDVEKIDDMPPDPNAPPSESKMVQQKKPFENNQNVDINQNDNDNDNDDNNETNWFDKYDNL